MDQWVVSPGCTTPGREGPSPQRHKCTKEHQRIVPSFNNPPGSSGVTIVGPPTAIATHNLAEPLLPRRSRHHWHLAVYQGPDITTVWEWPTPVYTHTARRCTSNTHTTNVIALCAIQRPTCSRSDAIERNPTGVYPQQRKLIGTIPPSREDTSDRRQVHIKEKEGYISKGFCAKPDLGPPCLISCCPCRGAPAQAPRQWQHEVRQGDTHDSGPAAIRVSPCQTSNATLAMAQ